MRPLLILAETRHLPKIKELVQVYGHPAVVDKFVRIIDVDLTLDIETGRIYLEIQTALQAKRPDNASEGYTVCATSDLAGKLSLKTLLQPQNIKLEIYSGKALAKVLRPDDPKKPELSLIHI